MSMGESVYVDTEDMWEWENVIDDDDDESHKISIKIHTHRHYGFDSMDGGEVSG